VVKVFFVGRLKVKRINFSSPIFICKTHQEIFFGRLRALPAYNCVIGTDCTITLLLNEPVDKSSIEELKSIFDHWTLNPTPLTDLQ
jgi:hypothetical protein